MENINKLNENNKLIIYIYVLKVLPHNQNNYKIEMNLAFTEIKNFKLNMRKLFSYGIQ